MTTNELDSMTLGQAVRVRKTGNIYIVNYVNPAMTAEEAAASGFSVPGPHAARPDFKQFRLDKGNFFGRACVQLNPASVDRAPEHDLAVDSTGTRIL